MDRGIPIRAISRAISVLQAINRRRSLTLTEIATETGLPYPTVCRIMQTLIYEGLVEAEPVRKKYRATALVKTLSVGYQDDDLLVTVGHPHLVELCRKIGWPVSIATRMGSHMVLRDTTHALTSMTLSVYHPGFRLPLCESASGKSHIAYCNADEHAVIVRGAEELAGAGNDLAVRILANTQMFEDIRRLGYATHARNLYTVDPGKTSSLAVPILMDGFSIASLTMSYFASAKTASDVVKDYLGDLQATAKAIAAALDLARAEPLSALDELA